MCVGRGESVCSVLVDVCCVCAVCVCVCGCCVRPCEVGSAVTYRSSIWALPLVTRGGDLWPTFSINHSETHQYPALRCGGPRGPGPLVTDTKCSQFPHREKGATWWAAISPDILFIRICIYICIYIYVYVCYVYMDLLDIPKGIGQMSWESIFRFGRAGFWISWVHNLVAWNQWL